MRTVAVLGAGSWGTAFSAVLADAGSQVSLWARRPELAQAINETRRNPDYLPDFVIPAGVTASSDPAQVLAGAEIVFLAVPSQRLRENLIQWAPLIPADAVVVSLVKGIELGTSKRMSEVITEITGATGRRLAVLSGPNLSGEIAVQQPAATVIACSDPAVADMIGEACMTPYFRPYTATDMTGVELAGATKNVVAVAVGMAAGMGLGENTKSTIITRGLAETVRLGVALGADPATFLGLAGAGDLIATCMSPLSRNHRVGFGLGRGLPLDQILAELGQTAEGVKSCSAIHSIAADLDVDMPIVEAVVAVVHDGQPPPLVADALMSRERKAEAMDITG